MSPMSSPNSLTGDLVELRHLRSLATRPAVVAALSAQISRWEEAAAAAAAAGEPGEAAPLPVVPVASGISFADEPERLKLYAVKGSTVVVTLAKLRAEPWSHYRKPAEAPPIPKPSERMNAAGDPGAGLMNVLKDIYQQGDDNVRREIAKAWTQSSEKKSLF